jgi:O-antigen ligase
MRVPIQVPIRSSASDAEALPRVPDREDAAETLHLWLTLAGVALQPISTATGNIGLGLAGLGLALRMAGISLQPLWTPCGHVAWTLCQVPELLRSRRLTNAWLHLLGRTWLWLLMAWLAWSWLSLAWSPDPRFGVEQFRATRVLLWIPLLWPLRRHWAPLVGAILVGTTVMALLQAAQMRFGWPVSRFPRGAGLTTPTQTGLWAAVALSFWLIVVVAVPLRRALLALPVTVLAGVSLVWSATRASVIGLMVELVLANLILCLTSSGWLRRAVMRALVGLVILGGAWYMAGSTLEAKVQQAVKETTTTIQGQFTTPAEYRLSMWEMALKGWWKKPLAGWGIGGLPAIAEQTDVVGPARYGDLRKVRMIHSTYIQVLTETGLVGALLFGGFAVTLLIDVLRGLPGRPLMVAGFGALVVWFVAAAFDGFQQSGGFLTVGAILIPLALAPRD